MKFLVCYGEKVVELHKADLSKDDAMAEAHNLIKSGYKNVRVRMEDPNHPTWPLHFDNEEKK